jgi:hypothetical protein
MGEGVRAGVGFGMILRDYLSVGIDGEWLWGSSLKNIVNQSFNDTSVNSSTTIDYSILSIIPNITFEVVSKHNYNIYNRLGIVIGFPISMTEDYSYRLTEGPDPPLIRNITSYHAEYKLKNGIGYQVTIGLRVKISDKVRGFVEISGYGLSLDRVKYEELSKHKSDLIETGDPFFPYEAVEDNSRNIIEYKRNGSIKSGRQGPAGSYVYTYVYPQDPIKVNAIIAGIGIVFRF